MIVLCINIIYNVIINRGEYMSSKIENKYRQMFESLDCTDSNYIDNFINLISNLLIERDSFVNNSSNDGKRVEFYSILKKILIDECVGDVGINYLSSGHSSLAFRIKNKVIKIGKTNGDNKRLKKDFPCTIPLFLDECYRIDEKEYYTIQLSLYVDTSNISVEDVYQAYFNLRKIGYIWNDPTVDNVGRIIEDFDYNGYHYSKGDIVIIDLEDFAYVGEFTPDIILDEICYTAYNGNVYKFETRYISENQSDNNKKSRVI